MLYFYQKLGVILKMENKNFEKRKKGIIITFNVIFWLSLANFVLQILIAIFGSLAIGKIDLSNYVDLLSYTITTIFMFTSIKLARNGSIGAGIIGVTIAIIEILFAGVVWKIIGILLLIDSIIYLIEYNKKNNVI